MKNELKTIETKLINDKRLLKVCGKHIEESQRALEAVESLKNYFENCKNWGNYVN